MDAKKVITSETIRHLKENEIDKLIILCEKHALYEKSNFKYSNQKENLLKHLFQNEPTLYCLIIEYENKLIGYATYMKQFSTWNAEFYLYMDCLFIDKNYRSIGLGKKLLKKIKEEAKKLECTLLQWQTPIDNKRAITFYKKNNAISKQKERFFLYL